MVAGRRKPVCRRRFHLALAGALGAAGGAWGLPAHGGAPSDGLLVPHPSSAYEAGARFFYETYSSLDDDTTGLTAYGVYRGIDRLTVFGEATAQRKLGFEEGFLSLGAAYRFADRLLLQETLGFGVGEETFPEFLSDTEAVYVGWRPLALHLCAKVSRFEGAEVRALYGGATWYPAEPLYVQGKVFRVFTEFDGASSWDATTSYLLKAGARIGASDEVAAYYVRNAYSFLSVDEVEDMDANTYGAVWNHALAGPWGLVAAADYEKRGRPSGAEQVRVELGVRYAP